MKSTWIFCVSAIIGLLAITAGLLAQEYKVVTTQQLSELLVDDNILHLRSEYLDQNISLRASLARVEQEQDIFDDAAGVTTDYVAVVGFFLCPLESRGEEIISRAHPGFDCVTVRGKVKSIEKIQLYFNRYDHIYFLIDPCEVMDTVSRSIEAR